MGARATEEVQGVQFRDVRRAFLGGLLVQRLFVPSEKFGVYGTERWLLLDGSAEEAM